MAAELSPVVQQALEDIYYNVRTGRGKAAFASLEKAAQAGDGDASCILGRCLCGYQYVWSGHGFPEDDDRAEALLRQSVMQGSALGVLIALRSGLLDEELQRKMPFSDLQSAFDQVEELALNGDAFCQYVVGNAYFWWDFIRIQGRGREDFPSQTEFTVYLRDNISKCENWFWKAFRGGVHYAANNLNRYYTQGDEGIILPQPEKARDLWKIGAEMGYPTHQYIYAKDLEKAGRNEEAFHWYKECAEGGEPDGWYYLGNCYFRGIGVPEDPAKAIPCFEKELARNPESIGSHNLLGEAHFLGKGLAQDYGEAFKHFLFTQSNGNTWCASYLAQCYFYGLGTAQDYRKALQCLDSYKGNDPEANYLRGVIYAQGLGVTADIPKGVGFLQKAGNLPKAKDELKHYKKTLFGRWVRK